MELIKYTDTATDYIVIDPQQNSFSPSIHNVQLLCSRHEGIGSDQLLYGPLFIDGKPSFKVFNADGIEMTAVPLDTSPIFQRYLADAEYQPAVTAAKPTVTRSKITLSRYFTNQLQ